jgi:hypothetical protein
MNRITKAFKKIVPETPMTKDETKLFINIFMSNDSNFHIDINEIDKGCESYKYFEPVINSFLAQVFLSRLEACTSIKMSLGALLILLHHIDNIAESVMYAYYLHIMFPANTLVDLNKLTDIFPMGLFSSEQLDGIWDIQKIIPSDEITGFMDNLLDYKKTWLI